MKPRWLLLAVSVICLLAVFPTVALSQAASVTAGCGTATIDGQAWPAEWANAGKVPLYGALVSAPQAPGPIPLPDVEASQLHEASGEMWVMHDESHFYVATSVALDHERLHPDWWYGFQWVSFTDEGNALDGQWDAPDCGPPLPGEGIACTFRYGDALGLPSDSYFYPASQSALCTPQPLVGVQWEGEGGTPIVFEYAFNLTTSELDQVGPGDCFRLGVWLVAGGCEWGSGCANEGTWLLGQASWPDAFVDEDAATAGRVCLEPCEVEFVPEPGSILLLGSGLVGLAGYAALRWRTRE